MKVKIRIDCFAKDGRMTKDYILQVLEILTAVLGVLALASSVLYTSKGFITRRTLLASFFLIVLFGLSLWLTIAIGNPSISLPVLICFGGVIVLIGISFAIKYATLPYVQKRLDKMLRKNEKD
jgi:hypothetical protein